MIMIEFHLTCFNIPLASWLVKSNDKISTFQQPRCHHRHCWQGGCPPHLAFSGPWHANCHNFLLCQTMLRADSSFKFMTHLKGLDVWKPHLTMKQAKGVPNVDFLAATNWLTIIYIETSLAPEHLRWPSFTIQAWCFTDGSWVAVWMLVKHGETWWNMVKPCTFFLRLRCVWASPEWPTSISLASAKSFSASGPTRASCRLWLYSSCNLSLSAWSQPVTAFLHLPFNPFFIPSSGYPPIGKAPWRCEDSRGWGTYHEAGRPRQARPTDIRDQLTYDRLRQDNFWAESGICYLTESQEWHSQGQITIG